MKVDDALLAKLEKLAMIHIGDDKKESFKQELSDIIQKMDMLQEVNTDSINLQNTASTPLREDNVASGNVADDVLSQAPNARDGYFIVPKIIG